ncbi:lipocalin family protein [Phenylobacterium sp.]|uniref:lipocalin family protein n=1 Tax=Phenylobacterium sp. TaxID=1871053 RepID=UPI0025F11D28|nr:lipocalin family protein [Phenylobacterium sp.]MBX3485224.1 lipocalin family protein [Phenylobacterium sp.]
MLRRLTFAALSAALLLAPVSAANAAVEPAGRIEISKMMGRWYEVARTPNALQKDCVAGASDWRAAPNGFAVVQSCHKGGANGPLAVWKAKATVSDPQTNAKLRMAFFGGVVTQNYVVLEHRPDQGWLALATADGRYIWLMSQKPVLAPAVRSQAIARIRQLGLDVARLEFPPPMGS